MSKTKLLILLMLLLAASTQAQKAGEAMQSYSEAEEQYNIGNFAKCDSILQSNLPHYSGSIKEGAYRLRALCALFTTGEEKAREQAELMFRENPYYTPTIHDPARFADLVEEMKRGGAKVSTASQQAESLDEVPVPVTVITEEMIEASGAQSLQDLLLIYVPGMNNVEGAESNIAMHGIYSTAQDKILIMLDGHRLNSHSTNAEAPDFRTSLDKIKQVEVLRGPASSLYGNVALTAVVNIITKKGHDMDGGKISISSGSGRTYRADIIMGKAGVGMSYSAWASIYQSRGVKRFITKDSPYHISGDIRDEGNIYIGGYNQSPSYDIGFNGQYKNLSLTMTLQNSKKVTSYSPWSPALYKYDDYRYIDDIKPGRGRKAMHANLTYETAIGKTALKATLFTDVEKNIYYSVLADTISSIGDSNLGVLAANEIGDSLVSTLLTHRNLMGYFKEKLSESHILDTLNKYNIQLPIDLNDPNLTTKLKNSLVEMMLIKRGIYLSQSWRDYTFGGSLQATTPFSTRNWAGNLLVGLQAEEFVMKNNSLLLGDDYTHILVTLSDKTTMLTNGNEFIISPFLQLKAAWKKKIILNCGVRYDHKRRFNKKNLNAVSPRASVIWKMNKHTNMKLGYAHSFVDAPYLYRANKLGIYKGNEDLSAEIMDAFQLNVLWNKPKQGLALDMNAFYNILKDIVYFNQKNLTFSNTGKINLAGIEATMAWTNVKWLASLSCSFQNVIHGMDFSVVENQIINIPNFTAKALCRRLMFSTASGNRLYLRANATFYTRQATSETTSLPARCIANAGLDFTLRPLTLSLDCYNILGTDYAIGSNTVPMPQKGRNVMAKLSYKF